MLTFAGYSTDYVMMNNLDVHVKDNHWWPPIKFIVEALQEGSWNRVIGLQEIAGGVSHYSVDLTNVGGPGLGFRIIGN